MRSTEAWHLEKRPERLRRNECLGDSLPAETGNEAAWVT